MELKNLNVLRCGIRINVKIGIASVIKKAVFQNALRNALKFVTTNISLCNYGFTGL